MNFFTGWIIFSILVGVYANSKGRSALGFTLLSLFISPLFGFILALIVAPIRDTIITNEELKKCKYCKELIKTDAIFCKHCGKKQFEETITEENHYQNRVNPTRDITKEFKYDTHFITINNSEPADFSSIKQTLNEQYKPLGYDSIATNKENIWKIRNSINEKTYIEVIQKNHKMITIEAYNVPAEPIIFPKESSNVDRIIELEKLADKNLITKEELEILKSHLK